jgi:hypothetical protein
MGTTKCTTGRNEWRREGWVPNLAGTLTAVRLRLMRRAPYFSLLLACASLDAATARAQTGPDTTCSYSRCALRVHNGFFSRRLVRASSGESIARLGSFGSGVNVLLSRSDSGAFYARQYQSRRQAGEVLGLIGMALVLGEMWGGHRHEAGPPTYVGMALTLASVSFVGTSERSLDRAVWWYNRDLPRP